MAVDYGDDACLGDLGGDVTQFAVQVLARGPEPIERLPRGQAFSFHQDALSLADDVTREHRLVQVVQL